MIEKVQKSKKREDKIVIRLSVEPLVRYPSRDMREISEEILITE